MSGNNLPSKVGLGSRAWVAWLGVPFGLAVVGVAVWLLVVYAHTPILAVWLAIAAIGWTLHRLGRASGFGVVFWIAGAAMLSAGLWPPISIGQPWLRVSQILGSVGFVLYLSAGILFLVASAKDRRRYAGNCAGCMIVFFSVIIPAVSAGTIRSHREGPEAVQETRQMILTLHRLTAEIEAIRSRIGRLPNDEAELVALRGQPMPQHHQTFRISYDRPDANDYRTRGNYHLQCGSSHFWGEHWDFWGWIFHFYGPDAVQRVYVETF